MDDFDRNQEVYFHSDDFLAKIGRNRNDLISVSYLPLPGAPFNNTLMCYTVNPLSQKEVGQSQETVGLQFQLGLTFLKLGTLYRQAVFAHTHSSI